jgi:hypothetical protein
MASEWFSERAEPGSVVAVEAWDHPLPLTGGERGYVLRELPVFEEETPGKWEEMERVLDEADFVVLASRRGYASLGRWPDRYGRTVDYYDSLFGGELGFEPVACFYRYPRLGPLAFADDPTAGLPFSLPEACRPRRGAICHLGGLDESSVVYDHPRAMVFQAAERSPLIRE